MEDSQKTHWKRLMNPDYIGAYWLPPGEDVTVVIDHVVREMITGTGGKKEECTVAHLKNAKPFILNATNCKTIAKLYGAFIEDWAGKKITLFATTTKMGGETVECLRIRPKVAERKKQPITDARLDVALTQIASGSFPVQKLYAGFELTPEQQAKVQERLRQVPDAAEPATTEPEGATA